MMNFMQKSPSVSENFAISLSHVDTWLKFSFIFLAQLDDCQKNIKSQSPKKVEDIFQENAIYGKF